MRNRRPIRMRITGPANERRRRTGYIPGLDMVTLPARAVSSQRTCRCYRRRSNDGLRLRNETGRDVSLDRRRILQHLHDSDHDQQHGPGAMETIIPAPVHFLEQEKATESDEDSGSHHPCHTAPTTSAARITREV